MKTHSICVILLQVMSQFIILFICFSGGYLLKRMGRFEVNFATSLNAFVIHISLPALVITAIHGIPLDMEFSRDLIFPVLFPWLYFFFAFGFVLAFRKFWGWSKATSGTLILLCGLGNTSFIGYSVIEAFYGKSALSSAVLFDQLGSFFLISTLGIIVAGYYSGRASTFRGILLRIVDFPPIWALAVGIFIRPWPLPEIFWVSVERLSQTLVPLALVSVGVQFDFSAEFLNPKRLSPFLSGLFFKLIFGTAALGSVFVYVFHWNGIPAKVSILESAMAPMITAGIVAQEFGLDRKLANDLVGVGSILSFLTLPVWYWILERLIP